MSEAERKVPKLRFPGFTEDWEQRKLGEIVKVYDNLRVPIAESDRILGNTPYYGANGIQGYIDGYTHNGEFILIAEDGANDLENYPIRYVSGKVWVNNHAHVVSGLEDTISTKFLGYSLKRSDIKSYIVGGSRSKLNLSDMLKVEVSYPKLGEQTQIHRIMDKIDAIITLHQRKLENLKLKKKALLQKLFPKNGEQFPELRFPGFTDAWEQRKLGEIVKVYDNLRVPIAESDRILGNTPYYGANGIQGYIDGYTHNGEFILIAEDGANDLENYPIRYVSGKVWVNNHAHVVSGLEDTISTKFLGYSLKRSDIKSYIVGGSRSKLNLSDMLKVEVSYPKLGEQTQIHRIMDKIDAIITLHQRKLEHLQLQKKALLQQMFV